MRDRINTALKAAQKEQNKRRIATLRLVNAAISDRDIALRGKGKDRADEDEITELLVKMVKQREESSRLYREGGRADLEQQELDEIDIIREFLPKPLSQEEASAVISTAIEKTSARSLRDMGKVMAWLKEHYRGQIDMTKASGAIKTELSRLQEG
jgi:uncharacterized protein